MMSFNIYYEHDFDTGQWNSLTGNSLVSSYEFASIWHLKNKRPAFLILHDNGEYKAGMVGIISGGKLFPRFESMIDGLDGGACALNDDPELIGRFYTYANEFFTKNRFVRISIHNPGICKNISAYSSGQRRTHYIYMNVYNEAKCDKKINEHIRSAERRGAKIVVLDNPEILPEFRRLVDETAGRHKTRPRYDAKLYERLFQLSITDDRVIWLGAMHDDTLVASRISLVEKNRIINWQSFSSKQFRHLKANYLMMNHIIKKARTLDCSAVDLGGSPDDAKGLIDFKQRWGGKEVFLNSFTRYNGLGKIYYKWRNRSTY